MIKKGLFIIALLLSAILVCHAQTVDFNIGSKFQKPNNHYGTRFYHVKSTATHSYYYVSLYRSYYLMEFEHNPPKFVKAIELQDLAVEHREYGYTSINNQIYYPYSIAEKDGKEKIRKFVLAPITNEGRIGAPITLQSMPGEGDRYSYSFTQSKDKNYFAIIYNHERTKTDIAAKAYYYDITVYDKALKEVWKQQRVKTEGKFDFSDYLTHDYSRTGFPGSDVPLGNDGSFALWYSKEVEEGGPKVTGSIFFDSQGKLVSSNQLPLNNISTGRDVTINGEKVIVNVASTGDYSGKRKYIPYYRYWFQDKGNGKTLSQGNIELSNKINDAGRLGTFGNFIEPIVVFTKDYVYVILEEFQYSTQNGVNVPYASSIHGDLFCVQHDLRGKVINTHYIPKTQRVTGVSWEYYHTSFVALPKGENDIVLLYQSIGSISRAPGVKDDDSYHTYQLDITSNGDVTKTKLFESSQSNQSLRVSSLVPLGNNKYLMVFEEKASGKPVIVTVK